ncbi:pre-mrna processing protein prp39-related [Holotrichia oblita]|uniref:Pre-mrna processing protein prp39-related n=1 Tax=Holotrichia oblita TaxID=644536 RepID=A0ACB9TQB2_HOLOL|nr:pre-mrna processing protein prp39-related [Holotrichia oblita]
MDSTEDPVIEQPVGRRTRSGKTVPTTKPTTRKTRKKVMLVEVEVSDEEETTMKSQEDNLNESSDNAVISENSITMDENEDSLNDKSKDIPSSEDKTDDTANDTSLVSNGQGEEVCRLIENDVFICDFENEGQHVHMEVEETTTAEVEIETKNDNVVEEVCTTEITEFVEGDEEKRTEEESVTQPIITEPMDVDESNEDISSRNDDDAKVYDESDEIAEASTEVEETKVKEMITEEVSVENEEESSPKDGETEKDATDRLNIQPADPDAENISEDELPSVQVAKVPETEEVSDEELPGPKRAELPADTEVVSEDELPAVKKEGTKRKITEGDYDPGSPTSESEVSAKKPFLDPEAEKDKEKTDKPKKLPELDKYWKAVNDDPTDFTGWTYLLQYVDQENDMEAAREAYDAFLSHYPYCYGYWRKYADYEKRKGNKKKCEEVFERGLKAIPLSVDLWIHYLTYVRTTKPDDEDFIRSQFERALAACGLEFRSDRLWDSYIKWETDAKRLQLATAIYDRLLATPTQGYTTHFDNFQEHVSTNPPNKILEVDEFLALRKEVKHMLKHDGTSESADKPDVPPGEDTEEVSSDEETKAIRERIISIRRKIHKNTVTAVTGRWNFEEGIKRPYFHVKPLERCQLKNWQEYLDYEIEHGDQTRIIVLFERCLIACALYEEFWLRFVHYLEGLKDAELHTKIKDVYERACTIHHIKKPNLHLQWAMFEESVKNYNKAAEILANIEKSVPNLLQVANRRINLERRREDYEKCAQLYEHYIVNSKNKVISTNLAIKYARFCQRILKNVEKSLEVLNSALAKDPNSSRLYLQLIDVTMQKDTPCEKDVVRLIDAFLEKEAIDIDQKILFAQRKLEFLEDFGSDIQCVQSAYEEYQKYIKQNKETKKKETKRYDNTLFCNDTVCDSSVRGHLFPFFLTLRSKY